MTARRNFDSDQLERLKVWFDINPSPSRSQVDHISSQIKAKSHMVWMWFHRERTRVNYQDVTPQKTKTLSMSKVSSSTTSHWQKVKTHSVSKRLDCNGNASTNRDAHEHVESTRDTRQERKAKQGHIRGILKRREIRQGSGITSAEEVGQGLPRKGVERRQQTHIKFREDSEANSVASAVIQRLGLDHIGLKAEQGSVRTEKVADPEEYVGVGPAHGSLKRKEKVSESLHHNRVRSSPRRGKKEGEICDHHQQNSAKIPQKCIKKLVQETKSYLHIPEKSVRSSISRTLVRTDTSKPSRVMSNSTKPAMRKVLQEADSQMLFRVDPVQGCVERTDKVTESQKRNGRKPAQICKKGAEKVSEKERKSLSHSEIECHVKQTKSTQKVKSMSVPGKIESNGNSSMNQGVHQSARVPEGKSQTGVTASPSFRKRTAEGESRLEKGKEPVSQRRVTEVQSSPKFNVHHRTAEKNLRHLTHRQVTDMSSSSIHIEKRKRKCKKEKRIKMLSHKATSHAATKVKNSHVPVLQGTQETLAEALEESKGSSRMCTNREGVFSVLSLPQGKAEVDLSDSSGGEDFQDDQNKRTHQLSLKRKKMVDSVSSGKSIPVLSRQRQHSALMDCSNRTTTGSNLRRIPLKPASPAKCEVSSTSTSQSSVISSTVEEASDRLNDSRKGCQKCLDSSESNSCEIAIRKAEHALQGKNNSKGKESKSFSGKRTDPVISDDKIWNPYHCNFLFKRELSVNLIKINLSSISDEREVTVSSRENPTCLLTEKKERSPPCNDDKTDINANMSVNFSSVPKATERSIWRSSVETSNKVWNSIASSTDTSHKEIPFIDEGATSLDQESNKLWSSIASSVELSHKEIPFIESFASQDGESTPTSSQDCSEIKEGQNWSNAKSIFDEDSCEVSSSVDVEKVPVELCDNNMEEIEDTSSAVVTERIEHTEKMSADVMETVVDAKKTSAEITKTSEAKEKISFDVMGNKKEVESSADTMESKKEVGSKNDANKVTVEKKEWRGVDKTTLDVVETAGEIGKTSAELIETTESTGIAKEEPDEQPDSDLYEDITSPDYDISSPYMVVDEVICSDAEEDEPNLTASQEEFSMESTQSAGKPVSTSSPKVNDFIELDNCSNDADDDEVIIVSASPAKRTSKESPEKEPLKNQALCNSKPVGHGMSAQTFKPSARSHTKCTCSKATENNDSPEVIDIDCCEDDDDEVILLSTHSTQASCVPRTKDVINQEIAKDPESQNLDANSSENAISPQVRKVSDEDVAKDSETFMAVGGITSSLVKHDNEEASRSHGTQQDICGSAPARSIDIKDSETEKDPSIQNAGLDDIELDMSCDTISKIPTAEDDGMSMEKLDTSKDLGCNDSSSSDELVIDMEACNQMECPLQEEDVSENITASASDAANEKRDTLKHPNVEADYSSSDELVIDMEAGDPMKCPQSGNDVSESMSASQSNVADVEQDTSEPSVEADYASSNELVIDMQAGDPMKCPQPGNDVSESISASQSDVADVEQDTSEPCVEADYASSNELVIDVEAGTQMEHPQPENVSGSTSVSQSNVESTKRDTSDLSAEADYSTSDQLVIDIEASDKMECPQPAGVSESISTSASFSDAADAKLDKSERSAEGDYSVSDELVIDVEAGSQMEYPQPGKDVSRSISASHSSVENVKQDKSESDKLTPDREAGDQIKCLKSGKDVSDTTNSSSSEAAVRKPDSSIDMDVRPNVKESQKSLIKLDQSGVNTEHDATYDKACDEMESRLQEKDGTENDIGASSDNAEAKRGPSLNSGLRDSTSDEPSVDMSTCEQTECPPPKSNAPEAHTSSYKGDAHEGNSDLLEETLVHENLTSPDELFINVTTCEQIMSSLQADAVSGQDDNAFPGDAMEEKMDQIEKVVRKDSASDDDLYIDVVTCDEVECPPEDDAFSKKSFNSSLDSSCQSKGEAVMSDAESARSFAGVVDQGPLDRESTPKDNEVMREKEVRLPEEAVVPDAKSSGSVAGVVDQGPSDRESTPKDNDIASEIEVPLPEEAVMPDAKSSRSVAGVVDQDPSDRESTPKDNDITSETEVPLPEEAVMPDAKSSRSFADAVNQGPLDRESTQKDSEDISEVEVPVPATDLPPSSVSVQDTVLQECTLNGATDHQLPDTDVRIKSEDFETNKDIPSGDTTLPHQENSTEKVKRPRTLNELVSELTQRLGISDQKPTPSPRSLDLPHSSVGINSEACSAKSPSSSTQTAQPPKPTQEQRKGKRCRVITNKNFKRPPISEAVQLRIQQLNPYPCDHTWMRNAAVVELAQKEAQLDCQPGETSSSQDHMTGALLEYCEPLLDAAGPTAGSLNFCYQPGMGPTDRDSKGATDRDSCSDSAASRSVNSSDQRVEVQPTEPSSNSNSHQSSTVETYPLLNNMLKSTEPLRKRWRTQSGDSKKKRKSRKRRRKSSDDIEWEISSKMDSIANRSFLEKDMREEWMALLRVMEESTFSENDEPSSNSGTVVSPSSTTARASDPSSPTMGRAGGLLSAPLRVLETSSSTAPAPASASNTDQLPTTASSRTVPVSKVDDLSDMPSIVRVFSLRDEEKQHQSTATVKPCGLGSFDPDSVRIVEEHGTLAQVYSAAAAAAATSTARRFQDSRDCDSSLSVKEHGMPAQIYTAAAAAAAASAARCSQESSDHDSSLPSYQNALALNRKRHSSQTYGSTDGVPPPKAPATVETGSTSQDMPNLVVQQGQTTTNIGPQQAPYSCPRRSDSISGVLQTLASMSASNSTVCSEPLSISPKNNFVINTPVVSPSSSLPQAATSVLASPPAFVASQPVATLISPQASVQPRVQPQVQPQVQPLQPSLVGSGTLPSLLNPLILNQEIQRRRLSASPPLCTPYPPSSLSASGQSGVSLNTLSAQPAPTGNVVNPGIRFLVRNTQSVQLPVPVNTQWSQPPPNVQLVPAVSQTYSNGLDSQATTLFYSPQGSTLTFLSGTRQ